MDLICPRCAEPWDNDSLHENDAELPYDKAYKLFRTQGCGAIFEGVDCQPTANPALAELADLLGDDSDGYAAVVDDFIHTGAL
jgi:hypothetical protein